jgi:perosamine synthetase
MDRIPIAGPWITQKEIDAVTDAAANAWYGNAGIYHSRFESALAEYVGVEHALALPSCTSAIHLALAALGVGPGDEVVVPEITWIASVAPVSYVGATPVFADVDADTWCMAPASLEACITPRTKALIPVDVYGGMPDMEPLLEVARRHGLAVIEDAAEAVGAEYRGARAGSFGAVGVFSFHGSKTLTTGEGGMLVTDDDDLLRRCRFLADHGRAPGGKMFWSSEVAYKYKMSGVQAALGLAQLERIDELLERKREAFAWYREELGEVPGVTLNAEPPGTRNTYWMVTAVLDAELGLSKEDVIAALGETGIDCRPFFYPLSEVPAYAETPQAEEARARNAVAYSLSPTGVNLPSALRLEREDVARVGAELRALIGA